MDCRVLLHSGEVDDGASCAALLCCPPHPHPARSHYQDCSWGQSHPHHVSHFILHIEEILGGGTNPPTPKQRGPKFNLWIPRGEGFFAPPLICMFDHVGQTLSSCTSVFVYRAVFRSLFKAIFSLFCPLVIFFFALYRGQTKYDRIFRCAVVDTRTLYRPVHASRGQGITGPQRRQ